MKRVKVSPGRYVWVSEEMLEKARRAFDQAPGPAETAELAKVESKHPGVRVLLGRRQARAKKR